MAVDDQEWFAAFPDRRLRMREATPEEAGPARPGIRMLAIVARGRAPFVFQAGRDFARLDDDRKIATLLGQMERWRIRACPVLCRCVDGSVSGQI
jgi:hypothetical protein